MGPVLIIAIIKYAIIVGALYFAVKLPLQIGGTFMNFWSGSIGKPLAGLVTGAAPKNLASKGIGLAGKGLTLAGGSKYLKDSKWAEKLKNAGGKFSNVSEGVKRHATISGLIKGGLEGYTESKTHQEALDKGTGRSAYEAIRSGASLAKAYKDQTIKADQADILRRKNIRFGSDNENGINENSETIREEFEKGIAKGNVDSDGYKQLCALLTAMAEKGIAKDEDRTALFELACQRDNQNNIIKDEAGNKQFKSGFEAPTIATDALVSQISNKVSTTNDNLGNTLARTLNSNGTQRSSAEIQKDCENIIDRKILDGTGSSSVDIEKRARHLNSAVNGLLINKITGDFKDYDELDEKGKALANKIIGLKGSATSNAMAKLNSNYKAHEFAQMYGKPSSMSTGEISKILTDNRFRTESHKDASIMIDEMGKLIKGNEKLNDTEKAALAAKKTAFEPTHLANGMALAQKVYTGNYDFSIPPKGRETQEFARKVIDAKHHKEYLSAVSGGMMTKLRADSSLTGNQAANDINLSQSMPDFQLSLNDAKASAGIEGKRVLAEMLELKKRHDAINKIMDSPVSKTNNGIRARLGRMVGEHITKANVVNADAIMREKANQILR
jgi:hypothetical protein